MNNSNSSKFISAIYRPVDIAGLVYVRIVFGLIMLWEVWRYFEHNRVYRYWIEPEYHFPYPGFEWLSPLPGDGMNYLFVGLGLMSVLIILGLFYRVAAALFSIGFIYMFLLEQGRYLNHFYLVCLLSFLVIFLPANRAFSLDSRFGWTRRSDTCPAWTIWLLRFQMGVVYFFGGIAKINSDWLAGEPLRDWLGGRADKPVVGEYLTSEFVVITLSWGGMLYDLLIPFLLLWRPTRIPAFLVTLFFHLSNAFLWNIGIFPWFSIAMSAVFFAPSWPRKLFFLPKVGIPPALPLPRHALLATVLLSAFCLSQVTIPLRHWVYHGAVVWTEQGHRFSWRMKLRSRDGLTNFHLIEKDTGRIHSIDPYEYLEPWQVEETDTNPDMMLRFARILKDDFKEKHGKEVSVHAHSVISVNGRPDQTYFSAELDLTEITAWDLRHRWMYPFSKNREPAPESNSLVLD